MNDQDTIKDIEVRILEIERKLSVVMERRRSTDESFARIEKRMDSMEESIRNLSVMWERISGGAMVVRILFYIIAPIVAALYWIKDHVR